MIAVLKVLMQVVAILVTSHMYEINKPLLFVFLFVKHCFFFSTYVATLPLLLLLQAFLLRKWAWTALIYFWQKRVNRNEVELFQNRTSLVIWSFWSWPYDSINQMITIMDNLYKVIFSKPDLKMGSHFVADYIKRLSQSLYYGTHSMQSSHSQTRNRNIHKSYASG